MNQTFYMTAVYLTMSEYGTRSFYSGGRARIETCTVGAKILDCRHFPFGAPQAPSNKLNPASRQRPQKPNQST